MTRDQKLQRRSLELLSIALLILLIPLITTMALFKLMLSIAIGLCLLSVSVFIWKQSFQSRRQVRTRVLSIAVGIIAACVIITGAMGQLSITLNGL